MNTLTVNAFALNQYEEVCLVIGQDTVLNILTDSKESTEGCVSITEDKANEILQQDEDFVDSFKCSRFVTHYERCSNVPYIKPTFQLDVIYKTLFCKDCCERHINVKELEVRENVYKFTNKDEYATLVNYFSEGYSEETQFTEAGLLILAQVEYYNGNEDETVSEFTILTNSEMLNLIG